MFNALQAASYDGWIIVEQDAPAAPLQAARQSREYLRDKFGL
jgi:sugar phosphate isomerase/epimerase